MSTTQRINNLLQKWSQKVDETFTQDAEIARQVRIVLSSSKYVLHHFEADPERMLPLFESEALQQPPLPGEFAALLKERLAEVGSEEHLQRQLRLFRQQQMVRIIWRDLTQNADLDETLESLSALADASIQLALHYLYQQQLQSLGTPRDADGKAQQLVVIGVGKLGARELNLSSDIDLVYCFPSAGETDGRRALSNDEFFTRLCRKLTSALNSRTVDGFVFRVDTRLRPFGQSGPLATNFDFMENYYQSQAREWERYAMIKARIVAGDMQAGASLLKMLHPFVYRRYLDYGAIDSLRKLKQLINDDMQRKGMRDNIKLGPGGIREIEFLGQAFQLIRGGRESELQIAPIQEVLAILAHKRILPQTTVSELIDAYRFLRLVENRIQAWRDEQSHQLPENEEGLERIALTMGFATAESFTTKLTLHRASVQHHFEQLFNDKEQQLSPLEAVWNNPEQQQQQLIEAGFRESERAIKLIQDLHRNHSLQRAGVRGLQLLDTLMPRLLELTAKRDNPEETLERLSAVIVAIARRTTYLELLSENRGSLEQLTRLLSASPWFMQWIVRQPLLLDQLIDHRLLYQPLSRSALSDELSSMLQRVEGDLEQEMEMLRHFVATNRLRVAAADISNIIPLMVVSDYLSEIAEVTLDAALKITWRDLSARHGSPPETTADAMGFAIVGYGKLGGTELGYGSDLDLLFLHNAAINSMTGGEKSIAAENYYARMAQRLIHLLTATTPSGRAYEIDMRLRPNGASGLLVSSLKAFESYQHGQAWIWEHQALVRSRAVSGDQAVISAFQAIRRQVICKQREDESLRSEVITMRSKMQDSLDKSNSEVFDLKQGKGGITDIEFMVQYLILREANSHPALSEFSDNIRLLKSLEEEGLISPDWRERLTDIYRVFRAAHHRLSLQEKPGLITAEELSVERNFVIEAWRTVMGADD
ncbi:MAG: bifunctional [glutamate--ammonia ligase]-adenylyl-L-tyrosine phosphorylase/[glutamate--ammonia-ligase] adenylyltransferase [Gammaproteobacteria bacterium]|nr:bifunctional [glutamate--ammonia ligase]-adenylyl-L-tyrosine phosphorylase/[glutamate--ammonia-ligase] adenylyltransferase [Gammaproteobacteria bacterium]